MQTFIELLAGFVALLASAALSQFGVDSQPRHDRNREVHRVVDCAPPAKAARIAASSHRC